MRLLYSFFFLSLLCFSCSCYLFQSEKIKNPCATCLLEFKLLDKLIEENQTEAVILNATTALCVDLKIENYPVCYGMIVNEYGHNVIRIFLNTDLSPEDLCRDIRACDSDEPLPNVDSQLNTFLSRQNLLSKKVPDSNIGYFIQLTDIHYDPLYVAGANVDCGEPLCCRESNGPGNSNRWGNYVCDLSPDMLQAYLNYLSSIASNMDFVVWTGDNPPHNIWEQSIEMQLNFSERLVNDVYAAFKDVPVYPCIGNHECYPADQFMNPWTQWLNQGLAQMWSVWLPADAVETVNKAIYYTTMIRPGFRLISLNTQYADLYNFYNLYDEPNMDNHTTWLYDTLLAAQNAGEKVLIIGHIPCSKNANVYNDYCVQYGKFLEEFNQTIVGNIYGHTHVDQYVVITNNDSVPIGTQFIAPSLTTYTNHNPSFRVFAYDRTTFELLDYYQYHVNLTQAILDDQPTFVEFYSALEAYNLPNLSPNSMYQLYERMLTNSSLLNEYYFRYFSGVNTEPCVGGCVPATLCDIGTYTDDGYKECLKSFQVAK
jgi:sphingomyelin phosphodiesterase